MTSENCIGVTQVGHDSEQRTFVSGFDPPGSYSKSIDYGVSLDELAALTSVSKQCKQFIRWECFDSMLLKDGDGWWVSRQGDRMAYWGGATGHNGKCACGVNVPNSCRDEGRNCNCDAPLPVWLKDEGYLTDKNTLPAIELHFGDTGTSVRDSISYDERGYYTLGRLLCWG